MTPGALETNLVPREMRRRRMMRRRLQFWIRAGGSYVAAVVLASAAVLIVVGGRSTSAMSELKDLKEQSAEFQSQLAKIDPQLKTLSHKLESRKVLVEQPDSGELLALISSCIDTDVVLRQLAVSANGIGGSAESTGAVATQVKQQQAILAGSEREPRHFDIVIRGVSKGEKGVSRLSDRLKALDLFDEVELRKTGSDPMSANAVSFEVFCALREDGGAK